MQKRKDRIMSLRFSEEEYARLKSTYATRGVRSLSELARDAILQILDSDPPDEVSLEARLQLLDGRVAALEGEVHRLCSASQTDQG